MTHLTVTDDARSLLVSPGFWYGGVLCLAVWSALYLVFTAGEAFCDLAVWL